MQNFQGIIFRHFLKSGPEARTLRPGTWDPGTLRPRTQRPVTQKSGAWEPVSLGSWDMALWHPGPWSWKPGTWGPDTQNLGSGSLELGNCDPETQNLDSRTLRIELVTQTPSIATRTTAWINFNCVANFDNKKLVHLIQKLRCSSKWTKTFTRIFWHLTQHKDN